MPRYPGRRRSKRVFVEAAVQLLLIEYNRYEPFVAACHRIAPDLSYRIGAVGAELAAEHERIQEVVEDFAARWNLDRVPGMTDHGYADLRKALLRLAPAKGDDLENTSTPESERIQQQIEDFEVRWHLDRIPGMADHTCTNSGIGQQRMEQGSGDDLKGPFTPVGIGTTDYEFPSLSICYRGRNWEWDATFTESFAKYRARIMRNLGVNRARDLPPEVQSQLGDLETSAKEDGIPLSDEPIALPRHVHWLFRRLCPQPDQVRGWEQIAEEERERSGNVAWAEKKDIRSRVNEIALDAGIELPNLPRGRPPRR